MGICIYLSIGGLHQYECATLHGLTAGSTSVPNSVINRGHAQCTKTAIVADHFMSTMNEIGFSSCNVTIYNGASVQLALPQPYTPYLKICYNSERISFKIYGKLRDGTTPIPSVAIVLTHLLQPITGNLLCFTVQKKTYILFCSDHFVRIKQCFAERLTHTKRFAVLSLCGTPAVFQT